MLRWLIVFVFSCAIGAFAQNSSLPSAPTPNIPPSSSKQSGSTPNAPPAAPKPDLTPPNSSTVNAGALPEGESSSKDDQIDLGPPPGDDKAHPNDSSILEDANPGMNGTHPWDPHKAAKDVEVGDFYFKRKNYRAAEDRYREALLYKDNDAIATYRLAVCLEKLDRPDDARQEYESYLKILPDGPQASHARKALDRLKNTAAKSNSAK